MTQSSNLTEEFLQVMEAGKEPVEIPKELKFGERKERLIDLVEEANELREELVRLGVPVDKEKTYLEYRYDPNVGNVTLVVGAAVFVIAATALITLTGRNGPGFVGITLIISALCAFVAVETTHMMGGLVRLAKGQYTDINFEWPTRKNLKLMMTVVRDYKVVIQAQKTIEKMRQPLVERFERLKPVVRALGGRMQIGHDKNKDADKRLVIAFDFDLRTPEAKELSKKRFFPNEADYNEVVILLGRIAEYVKKQRERVEAAELELLVFGYKAGEEE